MNASTTNNSHLNSEREFRDWFAEEKNNGLVDVKFAISSSVSDNAVSRAVLHSIVQSEAMIKAGIVEPHLVA